jgi:HEAT repeat protein
LALTLVLTLTAAAGAAPAPDLPAEGAAGGRAEADAFLADLAGRPSAEQIKAFDSLIAQLPPHAAPGDPLRARRILVAALERDPGAPNEGAAYRSLWFAAPEKSAPIILEAAAGGSQRGRVCALDLIHDVVVGTGRTDLFRAALPLLREAAVSDDKILRNRAHVALFAMGEEGIPGLLAMLANREPLGYETCRHIAQYPDIALPVVRDALKGNDPTQRDNALRLLESIAPEGRGTVPLLLPLLDDKDPAICSKAAFALGLYGDPAQAAVPRLLELIVADDPAVRLAASEALARIGIEADQIERLWLGALRIEAQGNNYIWFYPYGHAAASPGRAAVPELIKGLSHPDARVRRAAAYACGYLGPIAGPAALPLLKTASDTDGETAGGALGALGNLGSAAAPAAEGLVALMQRARLTRPEVGSSAYEARGASQLASIGPAALPALVKGLASDKEGVQAGCAKALGLMGMAEARPAVPRILKLFDESKNEYVRIAALDALIELGGDPKELVPRLRPLAASGNQGKGKDSPRPTTAAGVLAAMARKYLSENTGKPPPPALPGRRYRFNPADFSWGASSAGLQVGVSLPPAAYDTQKYDPDVKRLLVAIRNVGDRPVVLPFYNSHPAGLDVRLSESPDVLSPLSWGHRYPPELRELRPGQVVITSPAGEYRLAYGRRSAVGRWTPPAFEDKEYHVTVALRGLGSPDPPHLPCYASAAIRKECWQGEATSGAVATRLDSAQQREMAKHHESAKDGTAGK